MGTIAKLVAKLSMDDSDFVTAAARSAQKMAELGQKAVQCNAGLRIANSGMKASGDLLDSIDGKAKGAVKTLLKLGSAAAMIAAGVKAAHSVDKAQAGLASAKGQAAGQDNIASAYDNVTGAVTRAYEAFGTAFSKSAGLAALLQQLANIITNLTPAFEALGSALGSVVGFLSSSTPAAVALLLAFKALAIAMGALVFVLGILIKRQLIIWLTGASPLTWLLTAAQWALNAAWWAGTEALAAMAAMGALFWLPLLVVIGAVVAIVWALYKAWIWLTGALTGAAAETAKSTAAMAEGMNKAAEAAAKIEDEVDAAYRAAQQGDAAASTVEEFAAQLTAAGVGADEYQRRITALDVKLGQTEAIKKRAKALQDLADLQRKAGLAGRSENMKTVIELRRAA